MNRNLRLEIKGMISFLVTLFSHQTIGIFKILMSNSSLSLQYLNKFIVYFE
jgi:hypothetical protein